MKKTFITLICALFCTLTFSQSLQKGNVLGLHTFTPKLKEGVTMTDYTSFFITKAIPAYEKAFSGVKMYLIRSKRGQDSSSMGVIYVFKTDADRNKYFGGNGTLTDIGKAAYAKLNDVGKEFEKYEIQSNQPDKYNDWLIQ